MTFAYGILLIVAIVLLILYITLIRKKEAWLLVLYSSACFVNLGYMLLSCSKTLEVALFFNAITYLGHIFMLISMFLTVARLCGVKHSRLLKIALISVGLIVFAAVCTSGFLPWYYKTVELEIVDGVTRLVKTYGPLHVVYLIYVLSYFVMMTATIIWAYVTKRMVAGKHAGLLTAVVTCNIAMWIIEKFIPLNFEFLSVSYILSEGMLFFLYWMMQDYVHKQEIPSPKKEEKNRILVVDDVPMADKVKAVMTHSGEDKKLTPRQLEVLEGILSGKSRKEMAADLNISENTIKMHVSQLYEALGVSGRDEILSIAYGKHINS